MQLILWTVKLVYLDFNVSSYRSPVTQQQKWHQYGNLHSWCHRLMVMFELPYVGQVMSTNALLTGLILSCGLWQTLHLTLFLILWLFGTSFHSAREDSSKMLGRRIKQSSHSPRLLTYFKCLVNMLFGVQLNMLFGVRLVQEMYDCKSLAKINKMELDAHVRTFVLTLEHLC